MFALANDPRNQELGSPTAECIRMDDIRETPFANEDLDPPVRSVQSSQSGFSSDPSSDDEDSYEEEEDSEEEDDIELEQEDKESVVSSTSTVSSFNDSLKKPKKAEVNTMIGPAQTSKAEYTDDDYVVVTSKWDRKLLYKTVGGTRAPHCRFVRYRVQLRFYEHAVVLHERRKQLCFPSRRRMLVIPRYKITDVQTGAGARPIPLWMWLLMLTGIILVLIGAVRMSDGYSYYDAYYGYSYEYERSPGDKACLALGTLMLFAAIVIWVFLNLRKDYSIVLTYSNEPCCTSCCKSTKIVVHSIKKLDEEFLYNYVFRPVEQTEDPLFLHRFNHLRTVGIMDPVKDWTIPSQLLSAKDKETTSVQQQQIQKLSSSVKGVDDDIV